LFSTMNKTIPRKRRRNFLPRLTCSWRRSFLRLITLSLRFSASWPLSSKMQESR
ncbi:hypothetical protein S83_023246, partial [Arachis hypogaea]